MVKLNTAPSNHSQCFICKRKKEKLRQVPEESVVYAYKMHRMIITEGSRVCVRHFNEKNQIKIEDFKKINIKKVDYNNPCNVNNLVRILDKFSRNSKKTDGIFEPFKNLTTLDNEYCLKITGWTKDEFIQFSRYLKSLRNSKKITKHQKLALYRYYLKNGITQSSLALYMEEKSQQDISSYLNSIRVSCLKDAVPQFLGIKDNTREFYLKHSTPTCKIIYYLDNNTLVFLIDG